MSQRKRMRTSQDLIDDNLKQIFKEMTDQDLPDRFRDLIDKLRTQDVEGEEDDEVKK